MRDRALAFVALASLGGGQAHAAFSLRRGSEREHVTSYGPAATSTPPFGATLGGVEDPGTFPESLDRKGSTGITGPSDSQSLVFDQRRALGDGNSHWNWVHAAHGGSASVRNDLIHARNRGRHYFEIMRRSLKGGTNIISTHH